MNFTYEKDDIKTPLETFEWDNVWIEHANDENERERVLYIGDSISCVTRLKATAETGKKILFDGYGTSKALDNPFFEESIRLFARQQPKKRIAVIFNNGLHGWHLDEAAYRYWYEKTVEFLMKEFSKTPIYLLLTTHTAKPERNERTIVRNRVVLEIAEKYSLPVIDLYTVSRENENLLLPDGVHFSDDGYELLAKEILKVIKK